PPAPTTRVSASIAPTSRNAHRSFPITTSSRRCGTSEGRPEQPMHRRNILTSAVTAAGALFAAGARTAPAQTPTHGPDAGKVVYHLADLDKVAFVLGNIDNHLAGVGGPEKVTIELVIHGPALRAFHASAAN